MPSNLVLPTAGQKIAEQATGAMDATWYRLFTALLGVINKSVPGKTGTFTLPAAASLLVKDTSVTAASAIALTATNASAATLMGSAKALYISAQVAQTSFTVATASGANAAGTETFSYSIVG